MHFLGFKIERLGGKPLGNLRQTQEHVMDCERRLNLLEKHRKSVTVKTLRQEAMDDDIAEVLSGSTSTIEEGGSE